MRILRVFRILTAGIVFLVEIGHYLARRRNGGQVRPDLRLESIRPPFWGGVQLELTVRNAGTVSARDCRYCRVQRFTMDGGAGTAPTLSVLRWYGTDRFNVRGDGELRSVATLTTGSCPQQVLDDMVPSSGQGLWYVDAIVCRDSAGTMYRFKPYLGVESSPDVWSRGLLDDVRKRVPPAWTKWIGTPMPIAPAEWNAAAH